MALAAVVGVLAGGYGGSWTATEENGRRGRRGGADSSAVARRANARLMDRRGFTTGVLVSLPFTVNVALLCTTTGADAFYSPLAITTNRLIAYRTETGSALGSRLNASSS